MDKEDYSRSAKSAASGDDVREGSISPLVSAKVPDPGFSSHWPRIKPVSSEVKTAVDNRRQVRSRPTSCWKPGDAKIRGQQDHRCGSVLVEAARKACELTAAVAR